LHSEPATIPNSYRDKGIKEVTWKLGLPPEFEQRARFLANIGFASSEIVMVQNKKVVPCEVLGAVVDRQVREKLEGLEIKFDHAACARAQVIGSKNKKKKEYVVDCMIKTPLRLGGIVDVATGVPPSIVAQLQVGGNINQAGVWGPEQVIAPEHFFDELTKREMHIAVTTREDLA
jgi:saccharopine dehydrogenase-like NADP-dependent oxidoreductase